jgi:hypothetical protein
MAFFILMGRIREPIHQKLTIRKLDSTG